MIGLKNRQELTGKFNSYSLSGALSSSKSHFFQNWLACGRAFFY